MKKIVSLLLLLSMLTGLVCLAGCSGTQQAVEEGATVVTLYAQSFEEWINEYLKSAWTNSTPI